MSVGRALAVTLSVALVYLVLVVVLAAWTDPFLLYVVTLAHVVAALGLGLEGFAVGRTTRGR